MKARNTTTRLISTLMAFMLMSGLFVAMPQTAYAASQTVTISQGDSVNTIQTRIQNAIDTAGSGNTVTVVGSRTDVTARLELEIKSDVTVVWNATYSGTVSGSHPINACLLLLRGSGSFELVDGGSLTGNENTTAITLAATILGNPTLTISGGTVSSLAGVAIIAQAGAYAHNTLTISGGTVSGAAGIVIGGFASSHVIVRGGTVSGTDLAGSIVSSCPKTTIEISGGTVSYSGNTEFAGIYVTEADSVVKVSGGTVSASGSSPAIHARTIEVSQTAKVEATGVGDAIYAGGKNSTVTISGGTVSASSGHAIVVDDYPNTVNISGGFVFAWGTGGNFNNVILLFGGSPAVYGNGIVCMLNTSALTPTYDAGTTTDLLCMPANALIRWNRQGDLSGIDYPIGAYAGFLPTRGVTVNPLIISFESNGGSSVPIQALSYGDILGELPTPTREGYTFDGWYSDSSLNTQYYSHGNIRESFTLYARWTASTESTSTTPTSELTRPDSSSVRPDNTSVKPVDDQATPAAGMTGGAGGFSWLWFLIGILSAAVIACLIMLVVMRKKSRRVAEVSPSAILEDTVDTTSVNQGEDPLN